MTDWSLRPGFPEGRVEPLKTHSKVARDRRDGIHSTMSAPKEQVADVAPRVVGARRDHAESGDLAPRPQDFAENRQGSDVGRGASLCTVLHMVHQPSQDVTNCQLDQWKLDDLNLTAKLDQWEISMIYDELDAKAKELAKEQRMRWHLAEIQKRREEDAARTIIGLVFTFSAVAMLYWIWGITR